MASRVSTKAVQLNVEGGLEAALKELVSVDGEHASGLIGKCQRSLVGLEKKHERAEEKLKKKKRILEEQQRRYHKKREELHKAEMRMNKTSHGYDDLARSVRRINATINDSKNLTQRSIGRLRSAQSLIDDDEGLRARALMLQFLAEQINQEVPVKFTVINEHELSYIKILRWATKPNPVRWSDDYGRKRRSLCEFGPFWVTARLWVTDGSTNLTVYVSIFDSPDQKFDEETSPVLEFKKSVESGAHHHRNEDGHPHPHISTEGRVCLGDAQYEAIDAMKTSDYSRVIQTIMLVLTQFNDQDPHSYLYNFEPYNSNSNEFDIDDDKQTIMCRSCAMPIVACSCVKSTVSNLVVTDPDMLSPCGCTYMECLTHHERHNSDQGINGTGCFPKRSSVRYATREGQPMDSPSVPNKIQYFQSAIQFLDQDAKEAVAEERKYFQQQNQEV